MRRPKPGYESRSTPTEHILDAAIEVFLRQGYKKTSMDELAAGAGLSRPGLYFHFATKEQLFTAALERMIEGIRSAVHAALGRADLELAERLFAAFEALHPKELDFDSTARMHELVEAAVTNGPDLVEKLRGDFIRSVAATLQAADAGAAWNKHGVTAKQLAEHLLATSDGIKSQGPSLSAYRTRLRLAIQIVLQSAGGGR
jgi:AcrR family transcriptional regulator